MTDHPASSHNPFSAAFEDYTQKRISHWNSVAEKAPSPFYLGGVYARRLSQIFRFLIPPDQRVLELGCGTGRLLASLQPATGIGVDFSPVMIHQARQQHPHLKFVQGDAHKLDLGKTEFDYIILSDLLNDVWDIQGLLQQLHPYTHTGTRIIINHFSHLWQLPLNLAQKLNLANPNLQQNWITKEDVSNLLSLAGFQAIRQWEEFLLPLPIPLLQSLCNKVLVKLWPFKYLGLANFTIARPSPVKSPSQPSPRVSIIIPARNEEGNIHAIFARVPEMGASTELVFVEGHSSDNTWEAITRHIKENPERPSIQIKQQGVGKGDAVRQGIRHATGDLIMILDADLTVSPEDLPLFYRAITSNQGEFINGSRLVYPMERQAMRFLNMVGNKVFSLLLSWLIGQQIKDTLCGTKVFWKHDYDTVAANRSYFGEFDPFGDFDLIFGFTKINRKIIDIPIRYKERTYGDTNIQRWRHGLLLARMSMVAVNKLKFV